MAQRVSDPPAVDDPGLFWAVDSHAIHSALALPGAPIPQGVTPTQSGHDFKAYIFNLLCARTKKHKKNNKKTKNYSWEGG